MTTNISALSINQDLTLACDLTQQIIALTESVDTTGIEDLDRKRQVLIKKVFNSDKALIDAALAGKLLALNDEATKAIQKQLNLNLQQQKKQRLGSKAHNAYTRHL